MLREQWVVTLALSPLGLLLFGQMSLVALGANLLAPVEGHDEVHFH